MHIAMDAFFSSFISYLETSPICACLRFFLLVLVPKFQSARSRTMEVNFSVGSWYYTVLSSNGIK
jgi:hypothetical protein